MTAAKHATVHRTAFQDKELSSAEAENPCSIPFQIKDLSHKMHRLGKSPSLCSSVIPPVKWLEKLISEIASHSTAP